MRGTSRVLESVMYRLMLCLLLFSALSFSQAGQPGSSAAPQSAPAATGSTSSQPSQSLPVIPQDVPSSGAVITLQGLCPGTTGPATSADCKTIITRAQFEKLVGTLNPDMPKNSQQMLAEQYAKAMILQKSGGASGHSRDPTLQGHDGLHAHANPRVGGCYPSQG